MKWEVGQKVWVVYGERRGDPEWATITKIGRKWATIGKRQRFEIATGVIDGGQLSSPGRVYATKEEHEEAEAVGVAWTNLRRLINQVYSTPRHLRLAAIETVTRILEGKEQGKFGEPLALRISTDDCGDTCDDIIAKGLGNLTIASGLDEDCIFGASLVDCYNACSGMSDPAAEIAARDARIAELEAELAASKAREGEAGAMVSASLDICEVCESTSTPSASRMIKEHESSARAFLTRLKERQ